MRKIQLGRREKFLDRKNSIVKAWEWVGKNGYYADWRKDSVAREVGKGQTTFRVVGKDGAIY